jgi:carbonic anhydrase/acetyltransferase-like protein (isoleucine patch superfamily)
LGEIARLAFAVGTARSSCAMTPRGHAIRLTIFNDSPSRGRSAATRDFRSLLIKEIATMSIRSFRGASPQLGARVFIDRSAVVIGDVTLGDDVSVWPGAVIRGDMHSIAIGQRSNVQDNAVLHITHPSTFNPGGWPLTIGDDVVIGHSAVVHGCRVGDRVLVGIGAILNDGVVVEHEVIVGAGTVVPPGKRLPTGHVYVGNPCRALRPITDDERRFFEYVAGNYVKLKDEYLAAGSQ